MSAVLALASNIPWWALLLFMIFIVSRPTYIYRQYVWLRLGSKALDKADSDQIAAIMTAISGGLPDMDPSIPGASQ